MIIVSVNILLNDQDSLFLSLDIYSFLACTTFQSLHFQLNKPFARPIAHSLHFNISHIFICFRSHSSIINNPYAQTIVDDAYFFAHVLEFNIEN